MGSIFRSEEMTFCQLFLHTDSSYQCIAELGELGAVQFIDTVPDTNSFQRKFVNEVRRCEEMERKLRFFEKEALIDDIPILNYGENPPAPELREITELEGKLETIEHDLKEINGNFEQLKKNFHDLVEMHYLLQKTKIFFDEDENKEFLNTSVGGDTPENVEVLKMETRSQVNTTIENYRIEFVAGVIAREKIIGFERMIWRVCRGNVLIKFSDIDIDLEDSSLNNSGKTVAKSVFVVFFQGEQLKMRVQKICDAYHATIYPCTDNANERKEMIRGVISRMDELKKVLEQTQNHRHNVLVNAAKQLRVWFIKVRKVKACFHILNLFNVNVTDKCLIGECWCPVNDMDQINDALRRGMEQANGNIAPIINRLGDKIKKTTPPTFNRVNKFTNAFQNIVDAYGVSNYQEVNPMPFTVITFPFLFAVMFGDSGHGFIMFMFALIITLKEKEFLRQKSSNEIWNMFFGGRYIILLMGLFSIYTGFIYNDIFSKSVNVFGSSWFPAYDNSTVLSNPELQLNASSTNFYYGYPYPMGIDPVWQAAKNKITYTNNVKMKMSIILGVCQMLFGVILSFINLRFFGDTLSIVTEFIPQVIFLVALFGYLVVLIFVKWIIYDAPNSQCAPSLLIKFINMFMFKKYDSKHDICSDGDLFKYQYEVQAVLVILAAICIPWMLLIKPIVLYCRHRNSNKVKCEAHQSLIDGGHDNSAVEIDGSMKNVAEDSSSKIKVEEEEEEEEFDLGEIFVHQCIHTIEYCLGCISNTASYLRLWALSLAHAQLSEVLWQMVMKTGLGINGYFGCIVLFVIFAFWAVLTIAVLLLMEGLSAFLHALRLHWVEFQNKFYKGEGIKFAPFNFHGVDDLTLEF